jgi:nitroreductase
MSLLEKLQWRYATKKMDSTKVVPEEKVAQIVEAVRLTASSSGLQPYELIVVKNLALREKIKAVANGQTQITDCSHLIIFAAWDHYTAERINMMFDLSNEIRQNNSADAEAYRQSLLKTYPARDPELNFTHAAKQAYIGLGSALIAAAYEEVDCTPMEGFNPKGLDEVLNLKARGLRSVILLPLGYRKVAEDWLVKLKKVRRSTENFVTYLN